jgi:hypothetical protein
MRESEFWDSTPGAVTRYLRAYNKRRRQEWQLQASFYYTLGDLIGVSAGRFIVGKKVKYPSLASAFPGLFDEEDSRTMRSANNFRRFAALHNAKVEQDGRNLKS